MLNPYENGIQKFSSLMNSYNSVVSFTKMKLNEKDCILALDVNGILNTWIIKKENFAYSNKFEMSNDLLDFSEYNIFFPDIAFDISAAVLPSIDITSDNRNVNFTNFEKINDKYLIFTGNFKTFVIKKTHLETHLLNLSPTNEGNKTEIKNIEIDLSLNDFSLCKASTYESSTIQINGIVIDYGSDIIYTYSSTAEIFIYKISENNSFDFVKRAKILNLENYYNYDHNNSQIHSITTCRLIPTKNQLVCGTNKSCLIFLDSRNLQNLGIFSIKLNKFYEDLDQFVEEEMSAEDEFLKEENTCNAKGRGKIGFIKS
jgi:hypothetical protein